MKIILEDKAYLQKKDIAFIDMSALPMPAPLYISVFRHGTVIIAEYNKDEFVEIVDQPAIDYVKDIDFVVNIDDIRDKTAEEIEESIKSLMDQADAIAIEYNAIPQEKRPAHEDMVLRHTMLTCQIEDLENILTIKRGHKTITLPSGIEPLANVKKPNGFKQLIHKIKGYVQK